MKIKRIVVPTQPQKLEMNRYPQEIECTCTSCDAIFQIDPEVLDSIGTDIIRGMRKESYYMKCPICGNIVDITSHLTGLDNFMIYNGRVLIARKQYNHIRRVVCEILGAITYDDETNMFYIVRGVIMTPTKIILREGEDMESFIKKWKFLMNNSDDETGANRYGQAREMRRIYKWTNSGLIDMISSIYFKDWVHIGYVGKTCDPE